MSPARCIPGEHLRMPAEWERQEAVWMTWPSHAHTWPGHREAIVAFAASLAAHLSRWQPVRAIVPPGTEAAVTGAVLRAGADESAFACVPLPSNDAWCRDHGPTFVLEHGSGQPRLIDWRYNGWGGRFPPWEDDDALPGRLGAHLGLPVVSTDLVCEGGALDVDGAGRLLTTASVLLDPGRNPDLDRVAVAERFAALLGARETLWLPHGLAGDDTRGHVDMVARFAPGGIVLLARGGADHPSASRLEANSRWIRERHPELEPVALPMSPGPTGLESHANFLVLNEAVIVPGYGDRRADDTARGILADSFPGRSVETIDCRLPLREGGSLHCLTQQQPAASPTH